MDKVQKYIDRAIAQIKKLESIDPRPIITTFYVILLEHIVQCKLVTGNKTAAIQEIGYLCKIFQNNPAIFQRHRSQLHTLLGMYAMSMSKMDEAETQLNAALRVNFTILQSDISWLFF